MKTLELGHGLKLTESEDMGIFLHFKTNGGLSSGMSLDQGLRVGLRWAKELLQDVPDTPVTELPET